MIREISFVFRETVIAILMLATVATWIIARRTEQAGTTLTHRLARSQG